MPSPKLAVLYANLKSNIGDFAILHSILHDLRRAYPGAQIDVYPHGNYAVDRQRLAAFERDCGFSANIAGETYWAPVPMTPLRKLRKSLKLWAPTQAALIDDVASRSKGDAAKFAAYDAVYLAGGEHWGGTQGGVSMFGTLKAVAQACPRIFTYPFSLNRRITTFNSPPRLRDYFGLIKPPLLVRDQDSADFLTELGIRAIAGADCVFSLHDLADGVNAAPTRRRVILSITGSSAYLAGELHHAIAALPQDLRPTLMTTCESEDGALYQSLARDLSLEYIAPDGWMSAVAQLKACDLFVTNRLHGLIFGTLAGTTLLPVTDRRKSQAFAKDARLALTAAGADALDAQLLTACLERASETRSLTHAYKQNALTLRRSPVELR